MKKTWFIIPAAALLAAAPAQAQTLTWYGTSACFTSATPAGSVSIPSCNLSSATSTSVSWDLNDDGDDRSVINFQINEYNNSNSSPNSADWPGGPSSSANNRQLNFGGVGSTLDIYLGYFSFNREGSSEGSNPDAEDLSSVFLSMNLAFNGGTASYIDQFRINALEQSGPDGITFASAPWVNFDIGGSSYSFMVTGLDSPYSSNEANYCDDRDYGIGSSFTNDVDGKLCGRIRYNGRTQVAEPATLSLVAAGLMGLVGVARRRRDEA